MTQDIPNRLGNYRLVRQIGHGGMASVYLAKHIHLKHYAAVKVLTGMSAELFRQEAQTIMGLSHPNIIRVLDFGREEQTLYLIMDYAPYGSLRLQYPHHTIMPIEAVLSYTHQVAAALQYAHQKRIIHRDVKPENMLLGAHRNVLLSDFGIALMGQSSRTQDVAGTFAYMAPEQIRGKPRPASDQYALAITVYEWLCGELPFQGTAAEMTAQHLEAAPPPPHIYAPSLSPDVEEVILRALEKEPRRRFPTVMEFADALSVAAGGKLRKPKFEHFVTEVASSGTVRRDQEQTRVRTAIAEKPPALPSRKPRRSPRRGQPVTGIIDKNSRKKKTGLLITLAIFGILSVLILSVSVLMPKISYVSSDVHPTSTPVYLGVTPTPQEVTPTISQPTPSPTPPSALPITDLGTLNISDYCQIMGNRASLDQNNAHGWRCVTPSGNHTPVDTDAACQSQYHNQTHVLSRLVNYSDPNNWHCYSSAKHLGSIDINQYCQSIGKEARLNGNTVYDWRCVDAAGDSSLIDVNAVCRWQYSEDDALSSVSNYFDPQGWICLGKA